MHHSDQSVHVQTSEFLAVENFRDTTRLNVVRTADQLFFQQ